MDREKKLKLKSLLQLLKNFFKAMAILLEKLRTIFTSTTKSVMLL